MRTPSHPQRFDVDSRCPGRQVLERYLNRGSTGRDSSGVVRLFYVDAPTLGREPMAIKLASYAAANAHSDTLRERAAYVVTRIGETDMPHRDAYQHWAANLVRGELGAIPVFTIRCPIVCSPELRDRLTTLSRELVDLMDCGATTGSP